MDSNASLLAALMYANLFDFPLTVSELHTRTIGKRIPLSEMYIILKSIRQIHVEGEYVRLAYSSASVNERKVREKWSYDKMQRAKEMSKRLSMIPTIQFIGVSGSVAANNAGERDDIDLFIVTKRNTIWATRFFVLLLLGIFGARKKRSANLFCLNMLLDESHMQIPRKYQDIYTAYELLQLEPLFERQKAYTTLLSSNTWVKVFLPNFQPKLPNFPSSDDQNIFVSGMIFFNPLFAWIQKRHLKRLHTLLPKDEGVLRLHHAATRGRILASFEAKLHEFHLDKVVHFLYTRN